MASQKAPVRSQPRAGARAAIERLRNRPMRGLPVIYARTICNVERAPDITNETKADILAPWRRAKR